MTFLCASHRTASAGFTTSFRTLSPVLLAGLLLLPGKLGAQAAGPAPSPASPPATASTPDRSAAYYHYGLAHIYEEMAIGSGRPDYATQAVEEYKLALNADPTSPELVDGLAQLYFRVGRVQEGIMARHASLQRRFGSPRAPGYRRAR